ncbi:MAG: redox-regulated ATPase YchF [bacterium]|nr:redox-regulated ATPase YchF [bacterium]
MKLSIGIVGLPNVGKSTLFKALTKKQVDAENYPFCTIDPNIGTVEVPDERLGQLAKVYNSEKVIPTVIEFVDIAGLVAGAHKGEGLGNKFLSHIREVDVICQVVRNFHDDDVIHVAGEVNPDSDKQTINMELIFADLATLEKVIKETEPKTKTGDKEEMKRLDVFQKSKNALDQETLLFDVAFTDDEKVIINELNLLTIKPFLYVLNVDEGTKIEDRDNYLNISAKLEAELANMPANEVQEYLSTLGYEKTGLDRLIISAYGLLNLISFFTSGPKETRAWACEEGSTAPQAGSKIHSDFEEKFIRAEVANWKDIIEYGGEVGAKAKGKVKIEGKEYIVKDGDVIYFRI